MIVSTEFLVYCRVILCLRCILCELKLMSTSRERLFVEHVEHSAGDPTRVDGGQQLRLGDDVGAADVYEGGMSRWNIALMSNFSEKLREWRLHLLRDSHNLWKVFSGTSGKYCI